MKVSEALMQSAGLPVTDLVVTVTGFKDQLFSGGSGDKAWTRLDLDVADETGQSELKWWNPTIPNPQLLMGKELTISARPNSKNQWFGARTDVWQKKDERGQAVGDPVIRISADGDHVSLAGQTVAPSYQMPQQEAQVFSPPVTDVNADLRQQASVPKRVTDLELEKRMLVWKSDFEFQDATNEMVVSWVATLAIAVTNGKLVLEEIKQPPMDDEFAEYDG